MPLVTFKGRLCADCPFFREFLDAEGEPTEDNECSLDGMMAGDHEYAITLGSKRKPQGDCPFIDVHQLGVEIQHCE